MMEPGRFTVGCDVGGTFTDFVLFDGDTGSVTIEKCLSTPRDPADGIMAGLHKLEAANTGLFPALAQLIHASTLVANAVIERKGAKCALLCTAGFRDVLEVRRHVRVTTYELWSDPPEPLIPRRLRLPVHERTYADGTIGREVDGREIEELATAIREAQVESVAVAFLHSYVNPANERRARDVLAALLPDVSISLSSDVLPQIKEYERTSTTVVNAYVKPAVERYLSSVTARLADTGIEAPLQIMMSNGGIAAPQTAMRYPIRLIESGPVAGAKVVQHYGEICGLDDVLAFDMGGTTAKACLIQNGEIPITNELEVARSQRFTKSSGYPVAVPGAHLIEVGAGGGSIARVNALGLVQVGPQSAAAAPGPACYGLGGDRPTVTDADLVLGYLNPDWFAGGSMALSLERAERAITRDVCGPTGRGLHEAAWTVHDVINETMAAAVRMHMTERGGVVDRTALVAFGGAGPVHACNLAVRLGIGQVVVPLRAGVLSALGLIVAPPSFDVVRTARMRLADLCPDEVERIFRAIEAEIGEVLHAVAPSDRIAFARTADVGYVGQGYQVAVPLDDMRGAIDADGIWARFAQVYRRKYGYFYDDIAGEIVNLRVNGTASASRYRVGEAAPAAPGARPSSVRRAWSPSRSQMTDFAVLDRAALSPGDAFEGPAIVEELSSTTVIDVGGSATVDRFGSLAITVGTRAA